MNFLQELISDEKMKTHINHFLRKYGMKGFEQALQSYSDMQQEYICKTKTSIYKIKICDIYYLKINKHTITIHTEHDVYQKYGTLNHELQLLSAYKFVKCNQSCIVSLEKIKFIQNNKIILINHHILHMSRNCTSKIIIAFSGATK